MSLEVRTLLRDQKPADRAATAVKRLLTVVAEWAPGAGLDITLGRMPTSRRVEMRIEPCGPVEEAWHRDVRWALEGVARLRTAGSSSMPPPGSLVELRAAREGNALSRVDDLRDVQERRREERMATPWPTPRFDDLRTFLALLARRPELSARFRIGAAEQLESDIVADALRSTWTADENDLPSYLGRPVRLRALLGSTSGTVPAVHRAIARNWASDLRMIPVPCEEVADRWAGGPASLIGTAVPEGLALGLLRLPAAGDSPVPGMRSERVAVQARVLDPIPPRPAEGIRIGRARRVDGTRVAVRLALADLARHQLADGQSGSGKSTLQRAFARALAERDDVSFTFLDPHGETARLMAEETPARALDRTIYVRHGTADGTFGVNLLDAPEGELERRVDAFVEVIADKDDPRGEGIVGPRFRRVVGLGGVAVGIVFGPQASLVVLAAVLSDLTRIQKLARRVAETHPELGHRLSAEVGRLEGKEATDLTSWVASKFHPLVSGGLVRGIFSRPTTVDVRRAVDERTNLIVDLAMPQLGRPASTMLGVLWALEHELIMGTRADPSHLRLVIVDEAHRFPYGPLPAILAEGRKFGFGAFIATQDLSLLRGSLGEAVEGNAGSTFVLRSGARSAVRASARLGEWPPTELTRLADLTAATVLSRDGSPTEPFTLEIDHHRRMARRGPSAEDRARTLQHLESAAWDLAAASNRDISAMTDERIEAVLAGRRDETRLRPQEHDLESWLAARRATRQAAPLAVSEQPSSPGT